MSASEHPEPEPPVERRGGGRSRMWFAAVGIAAAAVAVVGLGTALSLLDDDDAAGDGAAPPPAPTTRPPSDSPPLFRVSSVDRALKSLTPANIAFNTPTELHLGEQTQVELAVSRRQAIEQLKKLIEAAGKKEGATIKVSDVMVATLSGLRFDIQRISDARQPVAETGVTEWSWTVEPTAAGTRSLHLTLTALIDVDGTEETFTVKTYDRMWTVAVPWPDRVTGFAGSNWQWLWTAILLPVVGLVWRRLRTRHRPEHPVAHG